MISRALGYSRRKKFRLRSSMTNAFIDFRSEHLKMSDGALTSVSLAIEPDG